MISRKTITRIIDCFEEIFFLYSEISAYLRCTYIMLILCYRLNYAELRSVIGTISWRRNDRIVVMFNTAKSNTFQHSRG